MALSKITFEIDTTISFEGFIPEKEKYQLIRKSSLLIACHFLFKKSSEWTFLRPYIASAIFRDMSFRLQETKANFVRKFFIDNDDLSSKLINNSLHESIIGSFELIVAEKYLTVVNYEIQVTGQVLSSFTAYVLSPHPHYSWESAIQYVTDRCSGEKYFPVAVNLRGLLSNNW